MLLWLMNMGFAAGPVEAPAFGFLGLTTVEGDLLLAVTE